MNSAKHALEPSDELRSHRPSPARRAVSIVPSRAASRPFWIFRLARVIDFHVESPPRLVSHVRSMSMTPTLAWTIKEHQMTGVLSVHDRAIAKYDP